MRRRRFWFVSVFLGQCLCLLSAGRAADAAADTSAFEGAWIGTIAGPDRSTEFGVAFTTTEKGQLVSVYLPEMFVYNVNFGPANIRAGTFHLDPLHLELHRDGDALTGAFGIPHLPVVLHAGTSFAPTPPEPAYPAAPAPAWTHSLGSAAWASPVARDGVVYVGTVDGSFHAVPASRRSDANPGLILTTASLARGKQMLFNGHIHMEKGVVTYVGLSGRLCKLQQDGTRFVDPIALLKAWGFQTSPGLKVTNEG